MKRRVRKREPEADLAKESFALLCWIVLMLASLSSIVNVSTRANPDPIVYVDDGNCFGNTPCYHSVKDGVKFVDPGGLVYIYDGDYDERVTVNKSVSLIGLNGSAVTKVGGFGGPAEPTFQIDSNLWVNISVKNNYQGILVVNSRDTSVSDVQVNWTYRGLHMDSSDNITAMGDGSKWKCYFGHNIYGMYLYRSSYNTIKNCTLEYNDYQGIGIIAPIGMVSKWNNISQVTVAGGGWPSYGIFFERTVNSVISNSTVRTNVYGIHVFRSSWNTIEYSNISLNDYIGISIHTESDHNNILNNNITENSQHGSGVVTGGVNIIYSSEETICINNNFAGNKVHALANRDHSWNNSTSGNYWSGFKCNDTDGDGICNDTYDFDNSQSDYLPLAKPADVGRKQ